MIHAGPIDLISISSIIAATKFELRLQDITDYDAQIEYLINRGARRLNMHDTYIKKSAVIDIAEGKAKLPCGMHSFIGLRPVFDPSVAVDPDEDYSHAIALDQWYFDRDFVDSCDTRGPRPETFLSYTFQIVGGYIVFTYPMPANITKCFIAYKAMNVDEKTGLFVLPADYEEPLSYFAAYKMLSRYPELYGATEYQPYYGTRLKELKSEWEKSAYRIKMAADVRDWENNKYRFKMIYQAMMSRQGAHA